MLDMLHQNQDWDGTFKGIILMKDTASTFLFEGGIVYLNDTYQLELANEALLQPANSLVANP